MMLLQAAWWSAFQRVQHEWFIYKSNSFYEKPSFNFNPKVVDMIPIMKPTLPSFSKLEVRFREIFESGWITNGKYVAEFERVCAEYLGSEEAVVLSNGTAALLAAVKCLELKGQVILPSFTWCATAHALLWNELEPVFVDIDPQTFNIDPEAIEKAITSETSAIMAVHMFGNPCNGGVLQDLADKHGLKLLYDGAHALGSKYGDDHMGSWGSCTTYSLSPTKIITTGEGGVVTTNDKDLADKIRLFRNQGVEDYNASFLGLNARMTEMQAILGIEMMSMVDESVAKKHRLLEYYVPELKKVPGISLQSIRENSVSSYKDFNIMVDPKDFGGDRNYLSIFMDHLGITTKKYYSPPVHRQNAYTQFFNRYDQNLLVSNWVADNTLTLPLYPDMPIESVTSVIEGIWAAHKAV